MFSRLYTYCVMFLLQVYRNNKDCRWHPNPLAPRHSSSGRTNNTGTPVLSTRTRAYVSLVRFLYGLSCLLKASSSKVVDADRATGANIQSGGTGESFHKVSGRARHAKSSVSGGPNVPVSTTTLKCVSANLSWLASNTSRLILIYCS